MAKEDLVSLSIDKDMITPIVEKHLKIAIIEAFGGQDEIIGAVVHQILNKKVDSEGKVNSYSSENKYAWIDIAVRKNIEAAIREELNNVMSQSTQKIKSALLKQLKSEKGANMVAAALVDGLAGTFQNNWSSHFEIKLEPYKNKY